MSRIAFATAEKVAELTPDDRLALDVLRGRGHDARAAIWTDPDIRWTSFDAIVLRSCWDYHLHPEAFAGWLDLLERSGANLQNPARLARWNMEKTYLRELARRGTAVVPTTWIEPGSFGSLDALRRETGWTDIVLKPAISATAWRLWRARADEQKLPLEAHAALSERLFLAQPFVTGIEQGEWSLVFFDGAFSHAVLKRPRAGDFRVQEEYGGRAAAGLPQRASLEAAEGILGMLPERPLYARVDGVETADGFVLLELELLEPFLFLGTHEPAAVRFADAIETRALDWRR